MIFSGNMECQNIMYRLNSRENMTDFANISKIISANEDEDINLEILSYRDAKTCRRSYESHGKR